ncbi:hypothetical protein [Burkholderia gladioli]|nr:hypothetical protein [Burkholderia gladioli]MDN7804552.1 hypothetical protein [Burkholderia gladioli]
MLKIVSVSMSVKRPHRYTVEAAARQPTKADLELRKSLHARIESQ